LDVEKINHLYILRSKFAFLQETGRRWATDPTYVILHCPKKITNIISSRGGEHSDHHRQIDTKEEDRYNYDDPRFHYEPKQRIPWKSVALALFLLSFGSLLLLVSYFLFTGHMGGEKPQASGFLVIGFLMFLPGMHSAKTPSLYSN
jgi:hypothetical protein